MTGPIRDASKYYEVEGRVVSVSHLFNLPGDSKCFFVHLLEDDDDDDHHGRKAGTGSRTERILLARLQSLPPTVARLQRGPTSGEAVGRRCRFTHLTRAKLVVNSSEVKLLVFTPQSTVELLGVDQQPDRRCDRYEGIVTQDQWAASGIYELDKRVRLVLSPICCITNLRLFRKGDRIHATGLHTSPTTTSGPLSTLIFACGRSTVRLCRRSLNDDLGEDDDKAMTCKVSMKAFKSDPLVSLCLRHDLGIQEILFLHDVRAAFLDVVPEADLKSLEFLERLLLATSGNTRKTGHQRSLLSEHLSEPHHCHLGTPGPTVGVAAANLGQVRQTLLDQLEAERQLRKQLVYKAGGVDAQFDFVEVPRSACWDGLPPIVGFFSYDKATGQLALIDRSASLHVVVVGSGCGPDPLLLNSVVTLGSFEKAVLEWSVVKGEAFERLYLVASASQLMSRAVATSLTGRQQDPNPVAKALKLKVLYSSGPLTGLCKAQQQPCFLVGVRQEDPDPEGQIMAKVTTFLQLPLSGAIKRGAFMAPPGSTVSLADRWRPAQERHCAVPALKKFVRIVSPGSTVRKVVVVLTDEDCERMSFSATDRTSGDGRPGRPAAAAYALSELDSEVPSNELVTIHGAVITDRWLEPNLGASSAPSSGPSSPESGPLKDMVLQVKVVPSSSSFGFASSASKRSVYFIDWGSRPFPLGLLPGHQVTLSNVVKVKSKKGHHYLLTTLFTTISVEGGIGGFRGVVPGSWGHHPVPAANCFPEVAEHGLPDMLGRLGFLIEATTKRLPSSGTTELFTALVSLEMVLKVRISAKCGACGHGIGPGSRCSYVGCHVGPGDRTFSYDCLACILVEDESGSATVLINDLGILRTLLGMDSSAEWEALMGGAAEKGELLYLKSNKNKLDRNDRGNLLLSELPGAEAEAALHLICSVLPRVVANHYVCQLKRYERAQGFSDDHEAKIGLVCLNLAPLSGGRALLRPHQFA